MTNKSAYPLIRSLISEMGLSDGCRWQWREKKDGVKKIKSAYKLGLFSVFT